MLTGRLEVVPIRVTERTFLEHYLKLRTRGAVTLTECLVLSEILKAGLLNRANRPSVREATGLGVYSFNNTINALKKKSLLDYNRVNRSYASKFPYPENLGCLVFKFDFI